MTQRHAVLPRQTLARIAVPGLAAAVLLSGVVALGGGGRAASTSVDADPPGPYEPPLAELSGEQIYQRVLDNRFDAYEQTSRLVSGDKAGNDQETRLKMWFRSFRGPDRKPLEGSLLSKTLVKYTHPFDIRHSGYLIINNLERPSDQFIYLTSNRRVRRVNLRGEAVFGTDFSFEDVVPKELEDSTYRRLPDEALDGVPCFALEAVPKDFMKSEYSRLVIRVEKERFVPLRTRYWDDREVEVKALSVAHDSIEQIEEIWVPRRMTMRNVRNESFTELHVEKLHPNPKLARTTFDMRRLEAH